MVREALCFLCVSGDLAVVDFSGLVHAVAGAVDGKNDGVMDQAVHDGGSDHGVAKVVPEVFKVHIGGDNGGGFAVAAVDDFEEQSGVTGGFLFEPVEPDFVYEQDVWRNVVTEFLFKRLVCQAREEVLEHGGGSGVAATVALLATYEQQGFCDVAFASTRTAGKNEPLLALDE